MVLGNTKETEDCYNKILSLSQNLKYTLKKNWEKYVSGYRFENKVKKDIKKMVNTWFRTYGEKIMGF